MIRGLAILIVILFIPFLEQRALPGIQGIHPDLLFLVSISAGLYLRLRWVLVVGLLAALSRSLLSIDSTSVLPLFYPLAGSLAHMARSFVFRDHVLTLCLLVFFSHLPVSLLWRGGAGGWGGAFLDAGMFSLYTALFAPLAFGIFRFLRLLREESGTAGPSHVS